MLSIRRQACRSSNFEFPSQCPRCNWTTCCCKTCVVVCRAPLWLCRSSFLAEAIVPVILSHPLSHRHLPARQIGPLQAFVMFSNLEYSSVFLSLPCCYSLLSISASCMHVSGLL